MNQAHECAKWPCLDAKVHFLPFVWPVMWLSILRCHQNCSFLTKRTGPKHSTYPLSLVLTRDSLACLGFPSLVMKPTSVSGFVQVFLGRFLALRHLGILSFWNFQREVSLFVRRNSGLFALNYAFSLLALQALINILCNATEKMTLDMIFS